MKTINKSYEKEKIYISSNSNKLINLLRHKINMAMKTSHMIMMIVVLVYY